MTPRFSVVIPTYNRADRLPQAVRSVLAQTEQALELIVVDDGSSDHTPAVMQSFLSDARVRYERLTVNGGRSAARNYGAWLASGELIGFLDSDDAYVPQTLQVHAQQFDAQPGLGLTAGGYQVIDDAGVVMSERRPWDEGGDITRLADWLFNCFATPGSVLMRRDGFERVGGFDPSLEMSEDWDLFLRLARAGCGMAWVRQPVFGYRQHAGSSIHAITRHREQSLQVLDKLFGASRLLVPEAALERPARAWVNVVFARKHFAAGQPAAGAAALEAALALNPDLNGANNVMLLEFLLAEPAAGESLRQHLPAGLHLSAVDVRRAESRVAMAQFFRLSARTARSDPALQRHLWTGIRLDPRWLLNRGVLVSCARAMVSALRR